MRARGNFKIWISQKLTYDQIDVSVESTLFYSVVSFHLIVHAWIKDWAQPSAASLIKRNLHFRRTFPLRLGSIGIRQLKTVENGENFVLRLLYQFKSEAHIWLSFAKFEEELLSVTKYSWTWVSLLFKNCQWQSSWGKLLSLKKERKKKKQLYLYIPKNHLKIPDVLKCFSHIEFYWLC